MANKVLSFIVSAAMFAFLIAGSVYGVEWAFTTIQVVYWVLYGIIIPLFIGVTIAILAGYKNPAEVLLERRKWWHWITWGIAIGLMFYGGLMALPIVGIIIRCYTSFLVYLSKKVVEDE